MNKKAILFASKGRHAASTRYRSLNYFDMFRRIGYSPCHIRIHGAFSRVRLLSLAARADVVVILRKTLSRPYLYLLNKYSKHLIFDLDDAIFCRDNNTSSPRLMKRFTQIVQRCGQIWVGNEYLAETARLYSKSVIVLPTSLSPQKYCLNVPKPTDTIDLVWIGSSSTRKYLEQAIPILEKLSDDFHSLRLKIIADFDLPSSRLRTAAIPWSEEREPEELGSAHIGIAPMPDNMWTRGKCGLKILQYMAAGLPVVSSAVGVNREIVQHGISGFFAETDEEWSAAIGRLMGDPDLRRDMGAAGAARVKKYYATDVNFRKMAGELDNLLKSDRA